LYKDGQEPRRLRKVAAESMAKGDLVRLKTGGGGGYGNPFERDPAAVLNDVLDGYITLEAAKNDYRVVINPQTMALDSEATTALRST
ncbi:MAG: 5-oxoprolinase, partial [Thaumarchaeota archaeon]|nr:5-oxoprolinase [Nitrososphaerota archaeon]